MANKLTILFFLLLVTNAVKAQTDSVKYRVIFIGDAGEMDVQQNDVLQHAASKIIPQKTITMYLGDNIYPHGMALPDDAERAQTEKILESQYLPFRNAGIPVYFVPGNHDWDRMGPNGLAKIKEQWAFLESKKDSLLKLIPANGCPDPVEINLTDKLTIIAFDSEWWLFQYNKNNPDADCACGTRDEVTMRMQALFEKNRGKVILLASHHPFQTYGTHGGYFSVKDHLFPLTAINKDLYIPLPGIGSLYPVLRTLFTNPEDMGHPLYKDMIRHIDGVFARYPDLVHVAGHDHGLQLIQGKGLQIVSGAGAKQTYAKKGKNSLFADATQGYVTVDLMNDNTLKITFYTRGGAGMQEAYTYKKEYVPVPNEMHTATPIAADSVTVKVNAAYNEVSGIHKFFFGKNYRQEWSTPVKLPVFKLSTLKGGLIPEQLGGGLQSKSLRLVDKDGKEWVLRSVNKSPEKLLPGELQETFARDWVNDAMSAQHPFSALVVPPLADAVGVPHANPVIGVVSADKNLGKYERAFTNIIALFEEREPEGESKNSIKMMKALDDDNDNTFDAREFLKARMLDLLIGDWDRHEDQWRWLATKTDSGKTFTAVPRDRDQVFYVKQGLIPGIAGLPWVVPTLQGFNGDIKSVKWSIFKTRFMNRFPAWNLSYDDWMQLADEFVAAENDEVLEAGLKRLPPEIYPIKHDELLSKLKQRRSQIKQAMAQYYKFANKIVDIRTTDKNELVKITGDTARGLNVTIQKISKEGRLEQVLMNKTFDANITKEIRVYVEDGDDSVVINNKTSPIKLRLIGKKGDKVYAVEQSKNKIDLHNKGSKNVTFAGDDTRFIKHMAKDSANTAFVPVDLYNKWIPLANIGLNPDDGFILGLGFKYIHQEGFRRQPFNYSHQLLISHSFATKAYRIKYNAEWLQAIGNADVTLQTFIQAPDNTANFFGRGNETVLNKTGSYTTYYRTRFNMYEFDPALRWRSASGTQISIGPSIQYYHLDKKENIGRFINNSQLIGSYDSVTTDKDKTHAGVVANLISDKRDNTILPTWGNYVNIKVQGYTGLNGYSKSFIQIIPEVAFYKSFGPQSAIVIADRFGGGVTIGKTTFYQSLFLGGQGNLQGYRQYRYAGQHTAYNNLELRIKLGDFANYILPGQVGLTGFFDVGRVWEKSMPSSKWHTGQGGGIYFAPARMAVLQLIAGNSEEGWYPYISMKFRY